MNFVSHREAKTIKGVRIDQRWGVEVILHSMKLNAKRRYRKGSSCGLWSGKLKSFVVGLGLMLDVVRGFIIFFVVDFVRFGRSMNHWTTYHTLNFYIYKHP